MISYHPKSRLNRGGFAKTRLNKQYLGELTWAGTVLDISKISLVAGGTLALPVGGAHLGGDLSNQNLVNYPTVQST